MAISIGFIAMFIAEWHVFFQSWQYAVSYSIALVMAVLTVVLMSFGLTIGRPDHD